MSLDLLVGYTGLVSLGHAAFFAAGAYSAGLAANHISSEIGIILLVNLLSTGILALMIGWLSLRLTGFYFLMITFAFAQIIYSVADKWRWLTGGADGLIVSPAKLFGKPILNSPLMVYYVSLGVFLFTWVVLYRVTNSPFGHTLIGIRENPNRMRPIGYNVRRYQIGAFTLAALFGGLAGMLNAQFQLLVSPTDANWLLSANVLVMVLIGGAGTLYGPILGTAIYVFLQNWLSSYTEYWMFVIGVLFVLLITWTRKGMAGLISAVVDKIRQLLLGTSA